MIATALNVGSDWLISRVDGFIERIERVKPSEFAEKYRYLPPSVAKRSGPMSYEMCQYLIEIVDCMAVDSGIFEVDVLKGSQVMFTTGVLESTILYFMAQIKNLPLSYITADENLAKLRIENNFLPMLAHSGFGDIIQSSDTGNNRKTGKNENQLQFKGGGYLVPMGAASANKARQTSIAVMMKDEIDAWPIVLKDVGCPDEVTDNRLSAYWESRKILRGSTPKLMDTSKIMKRYLRGDQREFRVRCISCNYPQKLRWKSETGGFRWEYENELLIPESVGYACQSCGRMHYEYDKVTLLSLDCGAHWHPTAQAKVKKVRSYHLPAFYSPAGLQPWHKCVQMFLNAYDPVGKRVKDLELFRVFYNEVLGWPFDMVDTKVSFRAVSSHKRPDYISGQIPNDHALKYTGSEIKFLTCTVDVQTRFLAVAIIGWTIDARNYLIEYIYLNDTTQKGCEVAESNVWSELREILERIYVDNNGREYNIYITGIDSNFGTSTVLGFCNAYEWGVYPIMGRATTPSQSRIKEFWQFTTPTGAIGYGILVDHYKDRLAPVLRNSWDPIAGLQPKYHFNAPSDILDKQLSELTRESRKKKTDSKGKVTYEWYRATNARNELWDLLVYAHALVEILAWSICIDHYGLTEIVWDDFWNYFD